MFELSIFRKDKLVARSGFTIEEVRIGRSVENEIQIEDRALSRYHASIEDVGSAHILKDFGSQNGTYVNGDRVLGRRALNDGDRILLGKYKIVFHAARSQSEDAEVGDALEYEGAGETDIAFITPEFRERPCPFVASLVAAPKGKEPPRLHPLVKDLTVVGAHADCDLVLEGAPPRSAAIIRGWRGFQLLALAPKLQRNGVLVPYRSELANGDELAFGAARLRYVVGREDVTP